MMTFSSKPDYSKNTTKKSHGIAAPLSQIQTSDNETSHSVDDNEPASNIHDIFAKRLRALKKRLQKIKRYEEILAQQDATRKPTTSTKQQLASPQDPKSPSLSTCPLNADQLGALKKKDYVLELIKEIEQLDLQVMDFERRHPKSSEPVQQPKVSQDEKDIIQRRQDVLMLWLALFRLDYIPSSVLNKEDSYAMRSLYALVHSIFTAKDHKSGMQDLLQWMNGQEQQESAIQDLLPPYKVIKHCITKILCAPLDYSKLPQTLSMSEVKGLIQKLQAPNVPKQESGKASENAKNPDPINPVGFPQGHMSNNTLSSKETNTRQSINVATNTLQFVIPDSLNNVDTLTRGWTGIPADSAILRTGPMFSKERSLNQMVSDIPAYSSFPLSTPGITSNIKRQPDISNVNMKGQLDNQESLNSVERPSRARRDTFNENETRLHRKPYRMQDSKQLSNDESRNMDRQMGDGRSQRRPYRGRGTNTSQSYRSSYNHRDDGEGSYE